VRDHAVGSDQPFLVGGLDEVLDLGAGPTTGQDDPCQRSGAPDKALGEVGVGSSGGGRGCRRLHRFDLGSIRDGNRLVVPRHRYVIGRFEQTRFATEALVHGLSRYARSATSRIVVAGKPCFRKSSWAASMTRRRVARAD
jgi:hypothetical protein